MTVVLLALMIGSATFSLKGIADNPNGEFMIELCQEIGTMALLGMLALMVKQTPGWAASISGGVYQNVSQMTGAVFGAANAAVSAVTGAARAGAAAVGAHAASQVGAGAVRRINATGRNLSA